MRLAPYVENSVSRLDHSLVNVRVRTVQRALDVLDVAAAAVVDSSDTTGTIENVPPLGNAVPMTAGANQYASFTEIPYSLTVRGTHWEKGAARQQQDP